MYLMLNPRVLYFNNGISGVARPSGFILGTAIEIRVFIGFRYFIGLCQFYLSNFLPKVYGDTVNIPMGGSMSIECSTFV